MTLPAEAEALARRALDVALAAGASYADARFLDLDEEHLAVRNGEVEGVDVSPSAGVGVRIVKHGYWGFASTGGVHAWRRRSRFVSSEATSVAQRVVRPPSASTARRAPCGPSRGPTSRSSA